MLPCPVLLCAGLFSSGTIGSMVKRVIFWAGVVLGAVSGFTLSKRQGVVLPADSLSDPLLGLIGEAVLVCDASGAVTYMNAAATEWFGAGGEAAFQLRYPSCQSVPPGQMPLIRTQRTGKPSTGSGYLCTGPNGAARILEISTRCQGRGGAVAIFRDITEESETRDQAAQEERREEILRRLCRRLSASLSPVDLARSITESASALLLDVPAAQVRLYGYEAAAKQLTRLASSPVNRTKIVRSQNTPQTAVFPLDVTNPLLWKVYVEREAFTGSAVEALGEEPAEGHLALPLIAGGEVTGHLSLSGANSVVLFAPPLRESLSLLASIGALALAGPSQAAQTELLVAQVKALREIVGAVANRLEAAELSDLVSLHARRVLGADICTLALGEAEDLRLLGQDYRDALLFPERHAPESPILTRGEGKKAHRTGKTVHTAGKKNPSLENGLWRVFAGQSGRHSVLSVPLPTGLGVVTVLRAGEASFSDGQVRFMETLAALAAAALPSAMMPGERREP